MGVEPTSGAYEATVLPLNYSGAGDPTRTRTWIPASAEPCSLPLNHGVAMSGAGGGSRTLSVWLEARSVSATPLLRRLPPASWSGAAGRSRTPVFRASAGRLHHLSYSSIDRVRAAGFQPAKTTLPVLPTPSAKNRDAPFPGYARDEPGVIDRFRAGISGSTAQCSSLELRSPSIWRHHGVSIPGLCVDSAARSHYAMVARSFSSSFPFAWLEWLREAESNCRRPAYETGWGPALPALRSSGLRAECRVHGVGFEPTLLRF